MVTNLDLLSIGKSPFLQPWEVLLRRFSQERNRKIGSSPARAQQLTVSEGISSRLKRAGDKSIDDAVFDIPKKQKRPAHCH